MYDGRAYYPVRCPGGPGSTCSTPAGTMGAKPVAMASAPTGSGYRILRADGEVIGLNATVCPYASGTTRPAAPMVAMADANGNGYWMAGADGGVFSACGAGFYGSAEPGHPSAPIVAAATPDGGGYWLLGKDGGIFSFGDAGYYGRAYVLSCPGGGGSNTSASCPAQVRPRPDREVSGTPVGIASAPDGRGYWITTSMGDVAAFGDAQAEGAAGPDNLRLAAPIVGITAVPTPPLCGPPSSPAGTQPTSPAPPPQGYWVIGSDGGVFRYGDAQFHGSAAGEHLAAPIVGSATMPPTSACPV
ncbi:MAG TPA: hypothetical protein VNH82_09585 [Candidatus Dormibacteraeota bacterium]|nr:hypothetical protein [Candidatus Dormibacteraeota bacterium]